MRLLKTWPANRHPQKNNVSSYRERKEHVFLISPRKVHYFSVGVLRVVRSEKSGGVIFQTFELLQIYPSEANIQLSTTRKSAFIRFDDERAVEVGQHLSNIVLIDQALNCVPWRQGMILFIFQTF